MPLSTNIHCERSSATNHTKTPLVVQRGFALLFLEDFY